MNRADLHKVTRMPTALLTDLYEISMAASYLRHGMSDPATFSLFVRRLPPNRGFLIAAGLEDCLQFLERFRFTADELEYVKTVLDLDDRVIADLAKLRFEGDVWALPEGSVVFANEPLLEVTAPIAQAQLVETYLLNQVTFQTTIASKGARCTLAARGKDLVDFSFRRSQGIEAGIAVARATAIAGFKATSNVEAARRYGLACSGTMAHSYIEAFGTEEEAFRTFAGDFPKRSTFLVDTYDTLHGVQTAARVIKDLGIPQNAAVRLDSGDIGNLAREARRLLDAAGLPFVRILASGSLDEHIIASLVGGGAPIDAFGVGTKVGVSADAPYLDSVYKIVAYGKRPVLKLSAEKATLPGAKQVFRHRSRSEDLLALRDEQAPPECDALLAPVMIGGKRVAAFEGLDALRRRCANAISRLPAAAKRLRDPVPAPVRLSPALEDLFQRSRSERQQDSNPRR